jgi:glutathione peroxidase
VKRLFVLIALLGAAQMAAGRTVFDFPLNSIAGPPAPPSSYKEKVALLVNVASRCGYTPQIAGLQTLYEKYKDRGFDIVGTPAISFGAQEPGTNQEIKAFCSSKHQVSLPRMAKDSVQGDDLAPLYQFLADKSQNPETGGKIGWNFTKFLIDPRGKGLVRSDSAAEPDSLQTTLAIEKALAGCTS